MKYHRILLAVISLLLCLGIVSPTIAQSDTTSSDGLFQAARHAAFTEDDYPKALHYCQQALLLSPGYHDIRVFMGRIYSWRKQYDSARICFETVLQQQPDYQDAALAFADMLYWSDTYTEGLQVCDKALQYHGGDKDLLLRKARMLNALRRYREAAGITNTLLLADKDNTEARVLASRIKDNVSLNKISISYDYVHFSSQFPSSDPWHLASLDYTRQTSLGSITGRINYANRFRESGLQYEIDAYPHLSKTFYSYINAGYSDKVGVFPHWRVGYSLYANLPASFEGELGWRYLYFSDATNIFTAYAGKYYKDFLFGFRTYLTPGGGSLSQSYNASARYYYGGADDFIGLTLGTGISPDDRTLNQQLAATNRLRTYKTVVDFRHSFHLLNIITFSASWINQELQKNIHGDQLQVGIGYQRRF